MSLALNGDKWNEGRSSIDTSRIGQDMGYTSIRICNGEKRRWDGKKERNGMENRSLVRYGRSPPWVATEGMELGGGKGRGKGRRSLSDSRSEMDGDRGVKSH